MSASETTTTRRTSKRAAKAQEAPAPAQAEEQQQEDQQEVRQLTWAQPVKSEHVYVSEEPNAGYTVKRLTDRVWSANFGDDELRQTTSRAKAMQACNEHRWPSVVKLTATEFGLLRYVMDLGPDGGDLNSVVISGIKGANPMTLMGKTQKAVKAGLLEMSGTNIKITDKGRLAVSEYRPPNPRLTADGSPRKNGATAIYGERPEGMERPTEVEYKQCQLQNALASLDLAWMHRRCHPFSPLAEKKLDNAKQRVEEAEAKLKTAQAEEAEAIKRGLPAPLAS